MKVKDLLENVDERFTPQEALAVAKYIFGMDSRLPEDVDYKLYVAAMPHMPYGVAKARTATPDEWYPEFFERMGVEGTVEWVLDHTVVSPAQQEALEQEMLDLANRAGF